MKLLMVICCAYVIGGCATAAVDNKELMGNGLPVHGHYCGPNVPYISVTTPDERIEYLKSINPIDRIDSACQEHDICYNQNSYASPECDAALLQELASLGKPRTRGCKFLVNSILSYFQTTNPGYLLEANRQKTILHEAWTPVEYVAGVAILGLSSIGDALYKLQESGWVNLNTGDSGKKRFDKCD